YCVSTCTRHTAYLLHFRFYFGRYFRSLLCSFFFFNDTATTEIYTLSLHDALPILLMASSVRLKPLNCSRLPCVYAQETLTFLLTQKKTCVKNYVQKE